MVAKYHHAGMTLVETILMVIVFSILVTMISSPFNKFIDNYRQRVEQKDMLEIQDAMLSFAKLYNRLPSNVVADNTYCDNGGNTWNECLAVFCSLSSQDILNSVWGDERSYVHYVNSEDVLGMTMDIHYATLVSAGVDRNAEAVSTGVSGKGIAVTNGVYDSYNNNNWWTKGANHIQTFQEIQPGGDDHLLKFTDLMLKVEKYKQTQMRLENIGSALASYTNSHRQQQLMAENDDAERIIYYPKTAEAVSTTDSAKFATSAVDDITAASGAAALTFIANSYGNPVNDVQHVNYKARLTGMVTLMRILGLPDSYCCNATMLDVDGTNTQERPFFYYANPIEKNNFTCGDRPQDIPFNPARIMAESSSCEY